MKTEPLTVEEAKAIEKYLETKNFRNHLLFTCLIETGLRSGDIRFLKVKDLDNPIGSSIPIGERKTGKENFFVITSKMKAVFDAYRENYTSADEWLFPSRKGNAPIRYRRVWKLFKEWSRAVGINKNLGAHSPRRTWGKVKLEAGANPYQIMERFNHSDLSVTMRYVGMTRQETHNLLAEGVL